MKILNLDPHKYSNEARLILSSFDYSEKKITRSKLLKIVHNYDVLVLRFSHKIDKQIIDKAKRLKLVATNATGTNHLDSKYLKKKKIKILSLQGNEKFMKKITASAEHTWGLVLALIRHIPQGYNDVLSNRWDREKYIGEQLYGKNLGIIGYGRNGKKISKIASSFGMKVFFFDKKEHIRKSTKKIVKCNSIQTLLKISDIIVLTLSLTDETRGLLDKSKIKLMKKESYIINTSRGEIINEKDLISSLKEKKIKGAALDVLSNESKKDFIRNNKLVNYAKSHKNLIITPHIAGATKDSWHLTEVFIAKQIKSFLQNAEKK